MKLGKNPSVTACHYDATMMARQALWNVCCASCGVHRFDCTESTVRSAGPVIRVRR